MPARAKSKTLKTLAGTDRPDRRASSAIAGRLEVVPEPPPDMSKRAAAEWRELAPKLVWLGTLAGSDLRAFAMLCTTLAREGEAREVVEREGFTVEAGSGGVKAHPALKALEIATMQATRLLTEFGLSPRGRAAIETAPMGAIPIVDDIHDRAAAPDDQLARLRALRKGGSAS